MELEKVTNGYTTTNRYGQIRIHEDLESVFHHMLLIFEGRSTNFKGKSFGDVKIYRKSDEDHPEVQPI